MSAASTPASKKTKKTGPVLVIVESPTKANTIRKYLGEGYEVEASVGHVRDLVTRKSDLTPKDKRRDEAWVKYGINIDNGFEPLEEIYRVPASKKRQIDTLKRQLKDATALYLATDDDREGEAISWHLVEELKPKVPVRRLVFREITKTAIQHSLESPRELDMDLVNAQRARRVVDRLYGWDVSQVLWRKIKPGLSAGRVQSVALRMLVQRERERIAFLSTEYWDASAKLVGTDGTAFTAALSKVNGTRVTSSRDFDGTTGERKTNDSLLLDRAAAEALVAKASSATPEVTAREVKPKRQKPSAPFTTSTLQQEANRKLRLSAQRTMRLAQSLYEQGLITYMRTDSTRLSDEALEAARLEIGERFGAAYVPDAPRVYVTKSAGAQEAHEAIRPAGTRFQHPDDLKTKLGESHWKLYDLIWRRAVSSQMADAQLEATTVDITIGETTFRASGRAIVFAGYLAVTSPRKTEEDGLLPLMAVGDTLMWGEAPALEALEHHTRPPARLTDATLVRNLEDKGIGRPSTYAAIIQSLLNRGYCFRRASALVPTFMGMAVVRMLEQYMPHLVDYGFTAQMEARLDAISRGDGDSATYLRGFYNEGFSQENGSEDIKGLVPLLDEVRDQIDPAIASAVCIGELEGQPINVRIGRWGTFVKWGDRTASVPEESAPDEIDVAAAVALIEAKERGDAPLGQAPDGTDVFLRNGRYGWYLQLGKVVKDAEKPKMVSISKGMKPEDVTLELALRQLALPREIGVHPEKKEPVIALVGRYGDYLKCGAESRSLPPGTFAIDVDLEKAVHVLAQPRARGREMIKEIGKREGDGVMLSLWRGRYGPYITDGTTNFNLGELDPEEVNVESATILLEQARRDKMGINVGKNPENDGDVRVLKGPWGQYVTDGDYNASLPKGTDPEDVDLVLALERLASYGKPVKKKRAPAKKKAATADDGTAAEAAPKKKAAAKKKAAPKKKPAAKKKAAPKKAAASNVTVVSARPAKTKETPAQKPSVVRRRPKAAVPEA